MEQIRIDLIPNGAMPNIHASQFDHGRTIRFNIYENGSPFSLLATDYVKVTCNDVESVSLANAGNSHDWTIPDSVVADSGVFIGELTIERDSVIVGSKNFVLNVEEDAYNGKNIEERTASGIIANFETNLQDNLTACKCEINPEQDLHGYSKPWAAGGGKNKLNYNVWKTSSIVNGTAVWENNGVTLTATANDCYTSAPNGFPSGAIIPISEGETITLSWEETTNRDGSIYIFPNNTTTGMVRAYNQQVKKLSYTATSGVTYVTFRFGVSNSGTTIAYKNIQIEKGSQATSFEPYENICPISGFSNSVISRSGKNLLNIDNFVQRSGYSNLSVSYANKDITISGYNSGGRFACFNIFTEIGKSYTVKYSGRTNISDCRITNSDTMPTAWVSGGTTLAVNTAFTFTSAKPWYQIWVELSADNAVISELQIENGSTASDYEPYNGQTATVNFGQTVYGGVLDVTNGKLTITHKTVDLGSISWTYFANNIFFSESLTDRNKGNNNLLCSNYKTSDVTSWSSVEDMAIVGNTANKNIYIHDSNYTDAPTFTTAMSGVQLVYELATPTEITLTPKQIEALVGINNVYHDCNGETEVKYLVEV